MEKQAAYKEFLRLKTRPKKEGDPSSAEEFCKKYNISIETYLSFMEEPTFFDDILNESLNWAKGKTPEVLHILYENIKLSKSSADIERFMNLVHELKKKKEERAGQYNQFNFFGSLSEEKFKQIAQREINA